MIYRETGQFKSSYASDQAIFPVVQDRIFVMIVVAAAFLVPPLAANEYWLQAVLIPFLIYALAAIGLNLLTGYAGQVSLVASFALIAKNLVRGRVGRSWMAIRDRDIAAELIGVRPLRTKLLAFAISSFYCGVAGAEFVFLYLGSAETLAFDINLSFLVLFMVIIGGLGSVLGSFLGAGFIVLVPIFLTNVPHLIGLSLPVALQKQMELMVFGALIIFFLIVEPNGLARLWQITKEKLRLWPFPH